MRIVGGYECEDGSLGCFVSWVIKGGPADMNNIELGSFYFLIQILIFTYQKFDKKSKAIKY